MIFFPIATPAKIWSGFSNAPDITGDVLEVEMLNDNERIFQ